MAQTSDRKFFLAVDAGGTKAEFLLADDSAELARVRVGSIKTLNTPAEIAEANFIAAIDQLQRASGVSPRRLARTCIGTSGFSAPSVVEWLRNQHRTYASGELILCGDEEIALDAAFEGHRGVLALAGTGSNIIGRTEDGRRTSAGGWGPIIGDEGSGHWIGHEAVRRVFHAIDEGQATVLEDRILSVWGLESRLQLIEKANTISTLRFAELTPAVVECADEGDLVAAETLKAAGDELARQVAVVVRHIRELEASTFVMPQVAVAGSILQSISQVRESMANALRRHWPEIVVRPDAVDAVLGALWRARSTVN